MTQVISSINQLIQRDATFVKNWLQGALDDELESSQNFNWLGLAEVAGANACNASSDNLLWAEIAVFVYEKLATGKKASEAHYFLDSAMRLRALMICRFDSVSGHPVLDVHALVHWFISNLNISYEEAEEKSSFLKIHTANMANQIDDLRQLRRIKNRLAVLSMLVECQKLQPDKNLSAWLSLRSMLP